MAAVLAFLYVKGVEERLSYGKRIVKVLVAKERIPARAGFSSENLELKEIPAELMVSGALRDFGQIRGRVAGVALQAGEQLTESKLLELGVQSGLAAIVPKGLRAITVVIDDANGMAGLVQPGDSIDLMVVLPGNDEQSEKVVTFLQRVLVVAVSRQVQSEIGQKVVGVGEDVGASVGGAPVELLESPATLTVAVTPDQAQQIALAEETGKIRITLRSLADQGQVVVEEISLKEAFGRQLASPPNQRQNLSTKKAGHPDTAEILRGVSKEVVKFKGFSGASKGGVETVETERLELE